MTDNLLLVENVSKTYFGNKVLDNVSLSLAAGEIRAVLGENGAGKSTLMNILFGMPVIHSTGGYEGRVVYKGQDIHFTSPLQAMAAGLGMVHQEFMLIPGLTVAENVKLNREPTRENAFSRFLDRRLGYLDLKQMQRDSRQAFDQLGVSIDEWAPVAGLPVGHKQFIEIAREIDKSSVSLVVLDEPTAVLTEAEARLLLAAVKRIAQKGIGVLFITHRLTEVLEVADSITMLRDGRVVGDMPVAEATLEALATLMVGRPFSRIEHQGREKEAAGQDVHLSIRDLKVEMAGEAVDGVDLDVMRGEILGIAGLAGQGKVGIANGIMGLYPALGQVIKDNKRIPMNNMRASLDAGLSFLSEDRRGVGLLLDEPLEYNLNYSTMIYRGGLRSKGPLGWLGGIDWRLVRSEALRTIQELDIRCTGPWQPVRRLSGGNQQKVCFGRALSINPDILLVSEPTRGIDVGAKERMLNLIMDTNRRGVTVVVTSSDLSELRRISDRIAIVYRGKVVGVLPPDAPDVSFGLMMSGKEAHQDAATIRPD